MPLGRATWRVRRPDTVGPAHLSLATASLDLLLLTAKRHLRRCGVFSTEVLRAPARTLDPREARAVDVLLDELAAAGVPGF